MNGDLAVVVLSCDKYADLWSPFLLQFRKHFPSPGIPVYIGSNLVPCRAEGVTSVLSGPDRDWSSSCRKILEQVPHRKVFVILEDLFFARRVDPAMFEACVALLYERDALHLKYWGTPAIDRPSDVKGIGIYDRGAPYRATVCGFWDREFLLRMLLDGESPWNFEILGSYRTSYSDGIYGVSEPLCFCTNMVEKGRWIPQSVAWARQEGIPLDLERRAMLEGGGRMLSRLKMVYFGLVVRLPWRWRLSLMNRLRLALISY